MAWASEAHLEAWALDELRPLGFAYLPASAVSPEVASPERGAYHDAILAGRLTAAETRVAALVAEGMKNREIGQALFMSVATVEAHLTRIYRKLDIRSRTELARLVADSALVLDE